VHQPFGAERDPIERIPDHDEVLAAGFGKFQALSFAMEQLESEPLPP
jgi:hypothetical protein